MATRALSYKGLRFIVVGSTCASFYFGVCYLLRALGLGAFSATVAAYAASFGLGYFGQKRITFRSITPNSRSLPRYAALHTVGGFLTGISVDWMTWHSALPPVYTALLATAIAGVSSFFVSCYWVFQDP
jgi:putative flippase GtrA